MDWSVKPFNEANHPPKAALNGDESLDILKIDAQIGAFVKLDASGSTDPDGDNLTCHWVYYPEPGTYGERHDLNAVKIKDPGSMKATLTIPGDAESGDSIHILLKVTDDGDPPLTRYRRIMIHVSV
jgi:hypothetical protein